MNALILASLAVLTLGAKGPRNGKPEDAKGKREEKVRIEPTLNRAGPKRDATPGEGLSDLRPAGAGSAERAEDRPSGPEATGKAFEPRELAANASRTYVERGLAASGNKELQVDAHAPDIRETGPGEFEVTHYLHGAGASVLAQNGRREAGLGAVVMKVAIDPSGRATVSQVAQKPKAAASAAGRPEAARTAGREEGPKESTAKADPAGQARPTGAEADAREGAKAEAPKDESFADPTEAAAKRSPWSRFRKSTPLRLELATAHAAEAGPGADRPAVDPVAQARFASRLNAANLAILNDFRVAHPSAVLDEEHSVLRDSVTKDGITTMTIRAKVIIPEGAPLRERLRFGGKTRTYRVAISEHQLAGGEASHATLLNPRYKPEAELLAMPVDDAQRTTLREKLGTGVRAGKTTLKVAALTVPALVAAAVAPAAVPYALAAGVSVVAGKALWNAARSGLHARANKVAVRNKALNETFQQAMKSYQPSTTAGIAFNSMPITKQWETFRAVVAYLDPKVSPGSFDSFRADMNRLLLAKNAPR